MVFFHHIYKVTGWQKLRDQRTRPSLLAWSPNLFFQIQCCSDLNTIWINHFQPLLQITMKHYKVMHKGIFFGKYRIGLLKEWANCSVCNIYLPASKLYSNRCTAHVGNVHIVNCNIKYILYMGTSACKKGSRCMAIDIKDLEDEIS